MSRTTFGRLGTALVLLLSASSLPAWELAHAAAHHHPEHAAGVHRHNHHVPARQATAEAAESTPNHRHPWSDRALAPRLDPPPSTATPAARFDPIELTVLAVVLVRHTPVLPRASPAGGRQSQPRAPPIS